MPGKRKPPLCLRNCIPRGTVCEALLVTCCIQGLILLGLAWGEYPAGTWRTLRGLAGCYIAIDVALWLIGSSTDVLGSGVARAGVYVLQVLVCLGYGFLVSTCNSP